MYHYIKVFINPYPGGWHNLPSIDTPIVASALQQHTNTIESLENYLYLHPIPDRLSDLTNDTNFIRRDQLPEFPENLSDFNNDVGYITEDDIPAIPTKTSELINDSNFVTSNQVPSYISDLEDDVGILNKNTNQLVNYYLKTETFNRTEIEEMIEQLESDGLKVELVDELPETGVANTLYFVPKNTTVITNNSNDSRLLSHNPIRDELNPLNAERITDSEVMP